MTYPEVGTNPGWGSHTRPTGDLIIPSTVSYGSFTYTVKYIRENTFRDCVGLTSVTIPNTVVSIGGGAFRGCTGLTSVTLSDSITAIWDNTFNSCTGLTGVLTIPNSVTKIYNNAFSSCRGLASVTIPNTVTEIGSEAFSYIRHIEYHGNALGTPWGALHVNGVTDGDFIYTDATKKELISYIGSGGTVSIPSCVTSIYNHAFYLCNEITSIYIPNSVTEIMDAVFYGCTGLISATIGDSVISIGSNSFRGCSELDEITCLGLVAPSVTSHTFDGVTSTIPIYIPCGSAMSYYSRWNYFSNFVEDAGFVFEAVSADSTMGRVNVLAQPTCQAPTAVIYAIPNAGYHFTTWNDGITENPRSLIVTQDTTIIAYFASGNGIDEVDREVRTPKVYASKGRIVIEGCDGMAVSVYDIMGRLVGKDNSTQVYPVGVYIVQVGDSPARKVVVVR